MITDIRLQNYRSFNDSSFELSPSVNIIVGPNASGKTNLLEAVLVLARGISYRAKDNELIKIGKPWARIDGHCSNNSTRTIKIACEPTPTKQYEIDGKTYKRLNSGHTLPIVLFEPNHLQLLSGSPERRRDYLDDLLEQTNPNYGPTRRQYKRALAQRNRLLKQAGPTTKSQMFAWDVRLSQLAGQIVRARSDITDLINKDITSLYKKLSKTKNVVIANYTNKWSINTYESQMLKKLEASYNDDRIKGFTSSGPHREDLIINFDDRPAQETASRGEIRTAVLALKIIELRTIEQVRDTTPLLLLDDVFSELDGKRRHALTDYLAPYQTFITTTDADLVTQHFTDNYNIIPLNNN